MGTVEYFFLIFKNYFWTIFVYFLSCLFFHWWVVFRFCLFPLIFKSNLYIRDTSSYLLYVLQIFFPKIVIVLILFMLFTFLSCGSFATYYIQSDVSVSLFISFYFTFADGFRIIVRKSSLAVVFFLLHLVSVLLSVSIFLESFDYPCIFSLSVLGLSLE